MSGDRHHISSEAEYRRYLEGSMSAKERHAFEKKMLDDDFESEAMDGLSTLKPEELAEDLDSLKARLNARGGRKSVPLLWRAAAVVTLLAAFSFAIYFVLSVDESENVAQSKESSPAVTEQQDQMSLKGDSVVEFSAEEDSASLLSYKMQLEASEEQRQAREAVVEPTPPVSEQHLEIELTEDEDLVEEMEVAEEQAQEVPEVTTPPVSEEPQVIALAEDADAVEEMEFADEAPAAGVAAVEQVEAEAISAAQLPTIEKEETMEMPLELEPEGKAKKSIASESVPPTDMDQRNFVARIKDVRTVTGKITAEEDDTPVPGVDVIVKGSSQTAITDLDGNYTIEVPEDEDVTLVYSFIGLATQEVEVADQESIDISMESDLRLLSEVIVTKDVERRSKSDRQPSTPAGPKGGNAAFEEYVKENIRYPESGKEDQVKGTVRLLVTVYPNGKITNIEVIKSLGEAFDQEAIRLVRESPGWVAATENGDGLTSKIKVKIRFRPPD